MKTILKRWCDFLSAANKKDNFVKHTLCLILFSFTAHAEEIVPLLTTELVQKNSNGTAFTIGDQIQLSVHLPPELTQELTSVTLKNSNETEPLDKKGWFIQPNPQLINGNLRFIVSPIQSGKLTLPELLIMKGDSQVVSRTSSITLDIAGINSDPNATPNYIDAISISLPLRFILMAIAIILLLGFIAYKIYKKHYTNKKKAAPLEIKLPPTPNHDIALRDLMNLYDQYPYSPESLKPIAFGVSQILKNYFSLRFKIDASESTTDEMIDLLRGESVSSADTQAIRSLFINLDLIKFTDLSHHQHFQRADYLEFKEKAISFINQWAERGNLS